MGDGFSIAVLYTMGLLPSYAGVSMAAPFKQIEIVPTPDLLQSIAFGLSGQGFAVGTVNDNRNRNVLLAFPTPSQIVTLWAEPFKIVYVP
jgi:hypothetical protein